MHILFYKAHFAWPRARGHDVHTFNMMRALSRLGAKVSLVTAEPPDPAAIAGIDFATLTSLCHQSAPAVPQATVFRGLAERYRSYWGIPTEAIATVGRLARTLRANAVVVAGLNAVPLLGMVDEAVRVWYAADELAWHHLSQAGLRPASWHHVREAVIKGLYERAFRRHVDRVWVVSDADRQAMQRVAGVAAVDVVPNGVDSDYYRPVAPPEATDTAVFWGRLDFGPNVQALEWFCRAVWPGLRRARPEARLAIVGFDPVARVRALTRLDGVELHANVPDIRPEVASRAVVVMPFVSGGGIKNKVLEAAAMGKAIVCTPRTLNGLRGTPPVRAVTSVEDWEAAVLELWRDPAQRRDAGVRVRAWVESAHTWEAGARIVLPGLSGGRPDVIAASVGSSASSLAH